MCHIFYCEKCGKEVTVPPVSFGTTNKEFRETMKPRVQYNCRLKTIILVLIGLGYKIMS